MRFSGLENLELDGTVNELALDRIRSRPDEFVKGLVFNGIVYYFPSVAELFRPRASRNPLNLDKLAQTALHFVTWSLTGLGLWHVRRRQETRRVCLLLLLSVFLYAVWYFPFLTSVEHTMYTFATMPILALLAAAGLVCSWRAISRSA